MKVLEDTLVYFTLDSYYKQNIQSSYHTKNMGFHLF